MSQSQQPGEEPATFGGPSSKREDVEMKNQPEDIYCAEEKSDDDLEPEAGVQEVLNPSKAKFNKFLEDIRLREATQGNQVPGTLGEGANGFDFGI